MKCQKSANISTSILDNKRYCIAKNSICVFCYTVPFIVFLLLVVTKTGHHWDTHCWEMWAVNMFNNGLTHTYQAEQNNYLFVYQYILYCFVKIQGSLPNIVENIWQLKYITLTFDIITTISIIYFLNSTFKEIKRSIFYALFYLLNVAIWYNSLIWGQIEGIMTCFIFASFIAIYNKNIFWTLIMIWLAVNTKFQSIIFVPVIVLLVLPLLKDKKQIAKLFYSIIIIVLLTLIVYLPFVLAGDFDIFWTKTFAATIGHSPFASANAYNFWYLTLHSDPYKTSDSINFAHISIRVWGIILFAITSFFALYHFIKHAFNKSKFKLSNQKTVISFALIPLLFFFFNTEMQDRFPYPALIFLLILAVLYKKYIPYILASIAYFLNLEAVLKYYQLNYNFFIFYPKPIALIYLSAILLLFYYLYFQKAVKNYF